MTFTLVPTSGELPFSTVAVEFNVDGPLVVSDFRGIQTVPASGPIDASDFYGLNGTPEQAFEFTSGHYEQSVKGGTLIYFGIGALPGLTTITAGIWQSSQTTIYGHTVYSVLMRWLDGEPFTGSVSVEGFAVDPGIYVNSLIYAEPGGSFAQYDGPPTYSWDAANGRANHTFNRSDFSLDGGPLSGSGRDITAILELV